MHEFAFSHSCIRGRFGKKHATHKICIIVKLGRYACIAIPTSARKAV